MPDKPIHRYSDGRAYNDARGHQVCPSTVVDSHDFHSRVAVVDLATDSVSIFAFLKAIRREMRIRFYSPHSIKAYLHALSSLLRFTGLEPGQICREHVREYLEYLVDCEDGAETVSLHLSAIRTAFDKMCFRDVTLGLVTPRRSKKLPTVLNKDEVRRLLQAAVSIRDSLLIGLMYATGIRVSEVCRVRLEQIDFERNIILIESGKGRKDRQVMLPDSFRALLLRLVQERASGRGFLFPSNDKRRSADSRHISTRTVQRVVSATARLAGISKQVTPHVLRHSFATHSFENGCDIRRIQKILGHTHLETTTIYIRAARPEATRSIPSPIDSLHAPSDTPSLGTAGEATERTKQGNQVGSLRILFDEVQRDAGNRVIHAAIRILISAEGKQVALSELTVERVGLGGWYQLSFPPMEDFEDRLVCLSSTVRSRIQSPEFLEKLQAAVLRRLEKAQPSKLSSVQTEKHACLND